VPIEVQCPSCAKKFRVAEKFAGKKARCANCQGVIDIPAADEAAAEAAQAASPAAQRPAPAAQRAAGQQPVAEQPAAQKPAAEEMPVKQAPKPAAGQQAAAKQQAPAKKAPAAKDEWYLQTEDGQQYGPVPKAELDEWVAEGRVDASCQLLQDGWEQWKWAEDVYSELVQAAAPAVEENPFAGIGDTSAPAAAAAINPFASPQTQSAPEAVPEPTTAAGGGAITPGIRRALAGTRPWTLFLSILALVVLPLAILLQLLTLVFGYLLAIPGVAVLGLELWAAYLLLVYSQKIGSFLRESDVYELERALSAQKTFWQIAGIVTIIGLVVTLLTVLVLVAFGAAILSWLSQMGGA
jgi:hypothetical protein